MKITAAVLHSCGGHVRPYGRHAPLTLQQLELQPPRRGELLIRIEAAGLCHSDLSVINGDRPRPVPMALGHEACGIVEELGDADDPHFRIGDRVVLAFLPACGDCVDCRSGRGYLCAPAAAANGAGHLLNGGVRLHQGERPILHHLGVSAFASHAVVDRRSAVRIDGDVPPEIAALFGCAVLTGAGAVFNSGELRAGESVIIHGLGGVGLSALLAAVAGGAQPVMAIDPVAEKRALALELGAMQAVVPEDAATLPAADLVIETVGKADVLASACMSARRGGRIVTVGLPNPAEMLSIPAVSLVAEAKTLIGSYMGSSIPARDIPRYIGLWKAGRLPVEKLLTSVSPLDDINQLLDRLADGEAVRQIMQPDAKI